MHEEKGTVVMYAIIQQGTKQFEVTKGQTYNVDKLIGNEGDEVTFKDVLLVVDGKKRHIGTPFVKKAQVTAKIISRKASKPLMTFPVFSASTPLCMISVMVVNAHKPNPIVNNVRAEILSS